MKLFAQVVCGRAGGLLIVVLLFLFIPAFIQAQNVGELPRDDRESIVNPDSSQIDQSTPSRLSAQAYMHLTAGEEARRLWMADPSATSAGSTPSPGSTNGAYVFPSKHERFKRYLSDAVGPWTLVAVAAAAGLDQWYKHPPEWGQSASGYGKRFASDLGENAIQQTTSYGLSEAFHLDSSCNKSDRSGFGPRLEDALLENVTSRTRTGKRVISGPRLAGFYVGGLVPILTWFPSRYNYKDGLREGTYALVFGFATNVIQEFILHR